MTTTASILASSALTLALGGLLVACKGNAPVESTDAATQQLATDGNEAAASTAQTVSFANGILLSVSSTVPATAALQASTSGHWWPAGCETRAMSGTANTVIISFNDCTGPFGLLHLRGTETVTFSAGSAGQIQAQFQSVNLTVNGVAVQHSATADITVSGTQRSVTWQGHWQRTNARGELVVHNSDLQVAVDTATDCRTTNGTAVTDVGAREIDSTFKALTICRAASGADECPTGDVSHVAKASGKSLDVTFDGSSTAVVDANGKTFDVTLVCGS